MFLQNNKFFSTSYKPLGILGTAGDLKQK